VPGVTELRIPFGGVAAYPSGPPVVVESGHRVIVDEGGVHERLVYAGDDGEVAAHSFAAALAVAVSGDTVDWYIAGVLHEHRMLS
jgi:hypothetical protein